jgi:hypothetical protein
VSTASDLLRDLARRGVILSRTADGLLHVCAPVGVLAAEERDALLLRRDELLDELDTGVLAALLPVWARLLGSWPLSVRLLVEDLSAEPPDRFLADDQAHCREALLQLVGCAGWPPDDEAIAQALSRCRGKFAAGWTLAGDGARWSVVAGQTQQAPPPTAEPPQPGPHVVAGFRLSEFEAALVDAACRTGVLRLPPSLPVKNMAEPAWRKLCETEGREFRVEEVSP